jgi:hypothetical protein
MQQRPVIVCTHHTTENGRHAAPLPGAGPLLAACDVQLSTRTVLLTVACLPGAVGQQNPLLISSTALLLLGALRAWWVQPASLQRHT